MRPSLLSSKFPFSVYENKSLNRLKADITIIFATVFTLESKHHPSKESVLKPCRAVLKYVVNGCNPDRNYAEAFHKGD